MKNGLTLEKKKKYLKGLLANKRLSLEDPENCMEAKEIFEQEIKDSEIWLNELENPEPKKSEVKGPINWKIDLLKNDMQFNKDILENDDSLSENDKAEFNGEIEFIKEYIAELRENRKEFQKQEKNR